MKQEQKIKENKLHNVFCKIECTLDQVVLAKQGNFFILVQFKSNNSEKSIKLRTQISALTNRPNFNKNIFSFTIGDEPCSLKFGLMNSKSQLDSDANSAMVCGLASIPITIQRLSQLPNGEYQSRLTFNDRGKQSGQFFLKIKVKQYKKPAQKSNNMTENSQYNTYNPLVSRVLYNEDVTDYTKLKNSIQTLQNLLQGIYGDLKKAKKQEAFFQKIYMDLQTDEQQLKTEIDRLEKINSKIEYQLESKQSLENLKIEVDLLGQSQEGKKVLLQKVEYFQDRIYRQIEQNQKLSIEYKKIRPELQKNLQKASDHANKLKGKQLQEFEIEKNTQILRSYEEELYQFKCNQQTIASLASMSKKSDLTAQQAKLLLSQAKYEVKLAELNSYDHGKKNIMNEERMLREIQKQMYKEQQNEQLSDYEESVYKIKLSAIQKQINEVKKKISKVYTQQS